MSNFNIHISVGAQMSETKNWGYFGREMALFVARNSSLVQNIFWLKSCIKIGDTKDMDRWMQISWGNRRPRSAIMSLDSLIKSENKKAFNPMDRWPLWASIRRYPMVNRHWKCHYSTTLSIDGCRCREIPFLVINFFRISSFSENIVFLK